MAELNKNIELIEDYLESRLNEEDTKKVEKRMKEDANFAAEVNRHRNIAIVLEAYEKVSLKQRWNALLEEEKNNTLNVVKTTDGNTQQKSTLSIKTLDTGKQQTTKGIFYYALRVAALVLLFAGAYLLSQNLFQKVIPPTQLAQNYFEAPRQLVSISRSSETTTNKTDSLYQLANATFTQKQYQKTITTLNQINESDTLYLNKGICYLSLKDSKQAIFQLEKVQLYTDSVFGERANWYLALSYLQNKQTDKARKLLEEIAAKNTWKAKESKEILKKLK